MAIKEMRYGGYILGFGDSDATHVYGKIRRKPPDPLPAPGQPGFIGLLQKDLRELGILLAPETGEFDARTEQAVREFQIYARGSYIAKLSERTDAPYSSRLDQVANPDLLTSPISGTLDEESTRLITFWRVKENLFRCPVVVEAWEVDDSGSRTKLYQDAAGKTYDNLWHHEDLRNSKPRVFVRDLSKAYIIPPPHQPDEHLDAGDYRRYGKYDGPSCEPQPKTEKKSVWPESEVLPANATGNKWNDLTTVQRSNFKVVRALAEQECFAYFDCVNAYDDAFASFGVCHWTAGNSRGAGELWGFLAYLEATYAEAFERAYGRFGIAPTQKFGKIRRTIGTYPTWVAMGDAMGAHKPLRKTVADLDYFRSWHWQYRWVMAPRTEAEVCKAMYRFSLLRLRNVLKQPWGHGRPGIKDGSGKRPIRIGDVFKSERAAALLLRWHVKAPAEVVGGTRCGTRLNQALASAMLSDPLKSKGFKYETWNESDEIALINAALSRAKKPRPKNKTFDSVVAWKGQAPSPNPSGWRLDLGPGVLLATTRDFVAEGPEANDAY